MGGLIGGFRGRQTGLVEAVREEKVMYTKNRYVVIFDGNYRCGWI